MDGPLQIAVVDGHPECDRLHCDGRCQLKLYLCYDMILQYRSECIQLRTSDYIRSAIYEAK